MKGQFIDVDVSRSIYDRPSVKAVFELYQRYTGISTSELQNVAFYDALCYLRAMKTQAQKN